jgi:hypothetical protein
MYVFKFIIIEISLMWNFFCILFAFRGWSGIELTGSLSCLRYDRRSRTIPLVSGYC